MRQAKSYSIVDHDLLHGGFLHELSHEALALYLFLVVAADREGKSYYAERTIMSILRLSGQSFVTALGDLAQNGLIRYSRPYFWVTSLTSR